MSRRPFVSALVAAGLMTACATPLPSPQALDRQAVEMLKTSFRAQGIAKMDRLDQDPGQSACSSADAPSDDLAKKIEAEALAGVQWPRNGRFIGDWRAGEKLAQDGRGMSWTDKTDKPGSNGGMCYNCHQIDKKEISFGTIGPSLWNYGKLRGVKDPADPASAAMVKYTWGKLWNSKAYAACSNMPRFGHNKLLTEDQLRDLMALLLDPKSPVNQ